MLARGEGGREMASGSGFLLRSVESLAQPDDRPLWGEPRSLLGAEHER